jgi:hypothetical protein
VTAICTHPNIQEGYCYNCDTQLIPRVIANAGDSTSPQIIKMPAAPLPQDDAERKALPILTFLCGYFPDAIVELTRLCVQGNIQHNPELAPTDIKWAREKSADQLNTAFRHIFERKLGIIKDADGQYHSIKAAWRNLAQAQLDIEADRK